MLCIHQGPQIVRQLIYQSLLLIYHEAMRAYPSHGGFAPGCINSATWKVAK